MVSRTSEEGCCCCLPFSPGWLHGCPFFSHPSGRTGLEKTNPGDTCRTCFFYLCPFLLSRCCLFSLFPLFRGVMGSGGLFGPSFTKKSLRLAPPFLRRLSFPPNPSLFFLPRDVKGFGFFSFRRSCMAFSLNPPPLFFSLFPGARERPFEEKIPKGNLPPFFSPPFLGERSKIPFSPEFQPMFLFPLFFFHSWSVSSLLSPSRFGTQRGTPSFRVWQEVKLFVLDGMPPFLSFTCSWERNNSQKGNKVFPTKYALGSPPSRNQRRAFSFVRSPFFFSSFLSIKRVTSAFSPNAGVRVISFSCLFLANSPLLYFWAR